MLLESTEGQLSPVLPLFVRAHAQDKPAQYRRTQQEALHGESFPALDQAEVTPHRSSLVSEALRTRASNRTATPTQQESQASRVTDIVQGSFTLDVNKRRTKTALDHSLPASLHPSSRGAIQEELRKVIAHAHSQ